MAGELRRLDNVNKELRVKIIRLKSKNKEVLGDNRRLQDTLTGMAERSLAATDKLTVSQLGRQATLD